MTDETKDQKHVEGEARNTEKAAWEAAATTAAEIRERAEARGKLVIEAADVLRGADSYPVLFDRTTGRVREEVIRAYELRGQKPPEGLVYLQHVLSKNKKEGGIRDVRVAGILGEVPEGEQPTIENAVRAIIIADSNVPERALVLDPNNGEEEKRQVVIAMDPRSFSEFKGPDTNPSYVTKPAGRGIVENYRSVLREMATPEKK